MSIDLVQQYRVILLALCLWREARGEGRLGMRGVGCVIRNRVRRRWYGGTYAGNITALNQFTSMIVRGDPNTVLWPREDDGTFAIALEEAENILNGVVVDITSGAVYYWNPRIATSTWFRTRIRNQPSEHPMTWRYGNHEFFA